MQPASAIVAGQLDERIIITAATNQLLSFRGAVSGVGSRGNCGQDIQGDHSFTCAQGGVVAYAGLGVGPGPPGAIENRIEEEASDYQSSNGNEQQ